MNKADFIAIIAPAARASMLNTGIPASFTLAQAALESGWGTSKPCAMACNLFDIKADASWHGPTYEMASTEHVNGKDVVLPAKWRMYADWQACIDDRAEFFLKNPRYDNCRHLIGGEAWARMVAADHYATDPQYADKMLAVIHSNNLTQFDSAAAPARPAV